ncbi:MAG TPA: hypothetical protein VKA34_10125 [Balneolales bacterium]|nr:hypothetical protein [Balneolales bacterium]
MSAVIETYNLGDIEVTISRTDSANRYLIHCEKDDDVFEFKAKKDEYEGYKRLMNRRIQKHFKS